VGVERTFDGVSTGQATEAVPPRVAEGGATVRSSARTLRLAVAVGNSSNRSTGVWIRRVERTFAVLADRDVAEVAMDLHLDESHNPPPVAIKAGRRQGMPFRGRMEVAGLATGFNQRSQDDPLRSPNAGAVLYRAGGMARTGA
jgi:hypothetical protein